MCYIKSKTALVFLLWILTGCAHGIGDAPGNTGTTFGEPNLVKISYGTADFLIKNISTQLDRENPILISSLVDINNIEQSSPLGRIMSDQIGSRLAQKGFVIMEVKLRESLYVKKQGGEFLLSRSVRDISKFHNAQAMLVGTYAQGMDRIYISTRILSAEKGQIISSYDFSIPLTDNLEYLIAPGM